MSITPYSIMRNVAVAASTLLAAPFYFSQNKAEEALAKFDQEFPQEKIHLILNKKNYLAGETLWFKSFVLDGYSPSKISTSIFVELYNKDKKQIDKKMLPLLNGEGSGSFTLPENLSEDVYFIRAYTTWMGNFSEDFNTLQPVIVYNPSSTEKLVRKTDSEWSATSFAESGSLIHNIETKIAVRLFSEGDTPKSWNGYVSEKINPDVKLVSFKGLDNNVGCFKITPIAGKEYFITISDDRGKEKTIKMPPVLSSGIHLQVESTDKSIRFRLKSNEIADKAVYRIIGTINSKIVFDTSISPSDKKVYDIHNDKEVNGVLHFTVFNNKNEVVAQRLCFTEFQMKNFQKPALKNKLLSEVPKESNKLNIAQNEAVSNYTVTVLDPNSESTEDENNLLSSLWLTGDFNSVIQQPAQYFSKQRNPEALDALLITEKWTRFSWKALLSDQFPIIKHLPKKYLTYKGKALKSGQPASNEEINLLFKRNENDLDFKLIKTDQDGFFIFDSMIFEDKLEISYQQNGAVTSKNAIQLYIQPDFSFIPLRKKLPATSYILEKRILNEELPTNVQIAVASVNSEKYLKEKITEIEEVKLRGIKKTATEQLNEQLSSTLFRGMSEMVFDFVNEKNMIANSGNILQWLEGRIAGVTFQLGGSNPKIVYRGSSIPLYVDEFQIQPGEIGGISPSDVAMIKFIRNDFRGVPGGAGGAVLIYTKRGNMPGGAIDSSKPSLRTEIKLSGYDTEAPFINNIYDDKSAISSSTDKRQVLYWNPYLENSGTSDTLIKWYNNDDAKGFKVIIMGFDKDNQPIYLNESLD